MVQKLISRDQSGFLKGRSIQDNLRLIQDVIDYANKDNIDGIICALDFKAAFNSIEHDFIWYTLRTFGFDESFINWIKLLYNDTELAVLNNGYTSEWFKPKRGVMQGCPTSGMLFNLAVEILATQIRNCSAIRTIGLNNFTTKISQYADDMTVFVKDEHSLEALIKILEDFAKVSGLELNRNKTKFMRVGNLRHRTDRICGMSAFKRIKILGIWFSATEDCQLDNINPIIDSICVTMNMWRQRYLSIKGRITVSKSLLLSKFVYVMPCISFQTVMLKKKFNRI